MAVTFTRMDGCGRLFAVEVPAPRDRGSRCPTCARPLLEVWGSSVCANVMCPDKERGIAA
jgi:hypothetical protein